MIVTLACKSIVSRLDNDMQALRPAVGVGVHVSV